MTRPSIFPSLSELSALLVDLHQQFDTLELEKSDFQREVIDDALVRPPDTAGAYTRQYQQYARLQKELKRADSQREPCR